MVDIGVIKKFIEECRLKFRVNNIYVNVIVMLSKDLYCDIMILCLKNDEVKEL